MRVLIAKVLGPKPKITVKISASRNDLGRMTWIAHMTIEGYWSDNFTTGKRVSFDNCS